MGDTVADREVCLEGISASPGIVIGPCFVYLAPSWEPEPTIIPRSKVPTQLKRFRRAVERVRKDLEKTYQHTQEQYGKHLGSILEIQIAILQDTIFLKEVEDEIEKHRYDAAYATFVVFHRKKKHFLEMTSDYFRDRALDIHHLKELIIKAISGKHQALVLKKPAIVVADTLNPTDVVQLHRQQVLGVATNKGGRNSHMAIVARSLGIPAVVGLKNITKMAAADMPVIVDGFHGRVVLNPSEETVAAYEQKRQMFISLEEKLRQETEQEARTADGKRIYLHANIEFEEELPGVLQVGADGIGLFRTEGIFINRSQLPSEEEQTALYSRVAEKMHPRKVIIRTLDIGGDKIFPGLISSPEENPFLGWRAIRFWLDHKTGFLAQLKAILRANLRGNVQILLPMVSGLGEVLEVKELLEEAKRQLGKEGKPFGESIEVGIMVEIPSAVVLADVLAREVDFFSIGTNDLVQYTLAVDRGNERVADLYSHFHPAVLRMIQMTIDAGREANIPVGMCGEMAGDPLAIPLLLAMGFEELSANHVVIPEIKKVIRELSLSECRSLYEEVRKKRTTSEVAQVVREFFRSRFPELSSEELPLSDTAGESKNSSI